MSATDELIASAELGEEAKKFLEGDLGRVLVGLAQQEIDLAHEALETADPVDTEAIRGLQNKIKVGRWFTEWLNQLVAEGEQAIHVYKQQQEI